MVEKKFIRIKMSMKASGMLLMILTFFIAIHSTQTERDFFYQPEEDEYARKSLDWPGDCKDGKKQSPINIPRISEYYTDEVVFENYNKTLTGVITKKNHFTINETDDVRIRTPNQKKTFKLNNIHFHWGCSEHLLNNRSYFLEAHLVHYNDQYENFQQALNSFSQNIAVVGVLFEVRHAENPAINVLLDMIESNSTYRGLNKLKISYRQLLPDKVKFLYQYEGSFTTPNCSQNVLWNVIEERSYISFRQLSVLRNLGRRNQNFSKHCRPVQPLNGRKIWKLKANVPSKATTVNNGQNLLFIFINLFYLRNL